MLGAPDVPLPSCRCRASGSEQVPSPTLHRHSEEHRLTAAHAFVACTRHQGSHLDDNRLTPAASPSTLRSRGLSRPIPCTLSAIANDAFLRASRNPLSSLVAPAALPRFAPRSLHNCPHLTMCTPLLTVSSAGKQTTLPRSALYTTRCRDCTSYRYYRAQSTPGPSSIR